MIFAGCSQTNTQDSIIINKKQNKTIPKIKTKKEISKNLKKTKRKLKKKKIRIKKYQYCNKHKKIMTHASKYIEKEFNQGYFLKKDIIGANAQLFLIENKSPSIFAKNINTAIKSYNVQYELAKKNKCNLNKFGIFPIKQIKNRIKTLEKLKEKK
jgi:hypothetical protein